MAPGRPSATTRRIRAVCAPGHPIGADGQAGQCPESVGLMQVRTPYMRPSIDDALVSSAYNMDIAFAIWRNCFEGNETWLNTVERGRHYAAGDLWGCVGRWFSGRWYTQPANDYIAGVQDYLNQPHLDHVRLRRRLTRPGHLAARIVSPVRPTTPDPARSIRPTPTRASARIVSPDTTGPAQIPTGRGHAWPLRPRGAWGRRRAPSCPSPGRAAGGTPAGDRPGCRRGS